MNSLIVNLLSTKEIALTESVRVLKQKEGIFNKKLVVIPNGIDTSKLQLTVEQKKQNRLEIITKYSIPEDAIILGCIGRLTVEKGHEVLIKAYSKLLKSEVSKDKKLYLIIAGGGILENELKKLVEELSIKDRVFFTGFFEDEEKIKILSSFDIFTFPSYAEGFGLSLAEAMYVGIPVISSDLDVLKEVGGDFIYYFKSGSSEDLEIKMEELIENIISGKNISTNQAKTKVQSEYSIESFVNNYLNLYKSLL